MPDHTTQRKLPPRRKLLFTAVAFLLVAVLVGGLAEIALRLQGVKPWQRLEVDFRVQPPESLYVKHPTLGYANRPGTFTITLGDGYSFSLSNLANSHRMTHPLPPYGAAGTRDEIWIFGCSLTYGWSLNDEETFPWLLQERFPQYEVVNFGVNGYGTVQSLIQLREALACGRVPRAVLLIFASFHEDRNIFSRNRRRAVIPSRSIGQLFHPYARLGPDGQLEYYLGEISFQEFPLMRYSSLISFLEQKYNKLEEKHYRMRQVTRALLLEFMHTAGKRQIPVVVAGFTSGRPTHDMLSLLAEKGIKTLDLGVDLNIRENTNYPHDGHPGPRASRRCADRLEAFLRAQVLP